MTTGQVALGSPIDGWWPAVSSSDATTEPTVVSIDGRAWVVYRPEGAGAVSVVEARCPHRLVSLAHASVVDGNLQCPYHGWQFRGSGECALIPSNGPDHTVPERAHLIVPWGVREADGIIWIAPAEPGGPPVPADTRGTIDSLTNVDPSLGHGWHVVALADELLADGELEVRLLGRAYRVRRTPAGIAAVGPEGPPADVAVAFGAVWLAPSEPRAGILECADDADPLFAHGWLRPERSGSPAGALAENFLDVAHFPFVHTGTFGAAEERRVEAFAVEAHLDGHGLTSVQDQWFDNPEDPGVVAGIRPQRQRRRATYTYRWPFQLSLCLEELDAGAIKTILFFLQPEEAGSTRIYTKMLLHGIGGVPVPDADVVDREVAFEVAVLAEDLALQQAMTVTGLPLLLRDELHVRSDRSGVALRRILESHRRT